MIFDIPAELRLNHLAETDAGTWHATVVTRGVQSSRKFRCGLGNAPSIEEAIARAVANYHYTPPVTKPKTILPSISLEDLEL